MFLHAIRRDTDLHPNPKAFPIPIDINSLRPGIRHNTGTAPVQLQYGRALHRYRYNTPVKVKHTGLRDGILNADPHAKLLYVPALERRLYKTALRYRKHPGVRV